MAADDSTEVRGRAPEKQRFAPENRRLISMVDSIHSRQVLEETSSPRILCIDDEPEMLELIRLILRRRGYEVQGAASGTQGLSMMRASPPDLVLLDLMMPDVDGWDVYQQMKADEGMRRIPVIIITAKAQSIDRVLGLQVAKVDDYVSKPFSPQDLLGRVEKVLAGRAEAT